MTICCWKFWKFCLSLNRTRLHKIRRPRSRNNYIQVSTTKIHHLFLRVEQETLNSSKNTAHFLIFVFQLQFMLKSQQKVDIKLSRICQSHQKLSEWQKIASRFTEIVVLCQNVKMSASFQAICRAICRPLGFSWTRDNRQLNFNDTDVGSCTPLPGFSDFAGFAVVVEITRLNTSEFLYYLDELQGNELVFAFSFDFVYSNNTDRAVFPTGHKVSLWFFWFN